jgi:hypothetical protein
VLDGTSRGRAGAALRARGDARHVLCRRIGRAPGGFAALLARAWDGVAGDWVCCITPDEVLYPNHLFAAAEAVRRQRARGAPPAIVHSGLVQTSDAGDLPELVNDHYNVLRAEHMRLVQFDFRAAWKSSARFPLNPASCLLHAPSLAGTMRRRFARLFPPALAARLGDLAQGGGIAFTASVTLATSSARRYSGHGQFSLPVD